MLIGLYSGLSTSSRVVNQLFPQADLVYYVLYRKYLVFCHVDSTVPVDVFLFLCSFNDLRVTLKVRERLNAV